MKNKITIILVLAIAGMTLMFVSQSSLVNKSFGIEQKAQAQSQIPPEILYDQMFCLVISFRKKSGNTTVNGQKSYDVNKLFQRRSPINRPRK